MVSFTAFVFAEAQAMVESDMSNETMMNDFIDPPLLNIKYQSAVSQATEVFQFGNIFTRCRKGDQKIAINVRITQRLDFIGRSVNS